MKHINMAMRFAVFLYAPRHFLIGLIWRVAQLSFLSSKPQNKIL